MRLNSPAVLATTTEKLPPALELFVGEESAIRKGRVRTTARVRMMLSLPIYKTVLIIPRHEVSSTYLSPVLATFYDNYEDT